MPAKHFIHLLIVLCLAGTTKAQSLSEKKEVLHVVIDSLLSKRGYPEMIKKPLHLLQRKTFSMQKEDLVKYIIQSGYVHYEWKDTVALFNALHNDTLLTGDEFVNGGQVFYSNNLNEFNRPWENIIQTDSVKFKDRTVLRVKLSTPVFSDNGKNCWVIVCYSDLWACYLLKKNMSNFWKIAEYVDGALICGISVNADEYFKITGKKLEIDFTDDL